MKKSRLFYTWLFFIFFIVIVVVSVLIFLDSYNPAKTDITRTKNSIGSEKKEQTDYNIFGEDSKTELSEVDFDKRLKEIGAKVGDKVFIRIFKKESLLEVWIKKDSEYKLFKRYAVCKYSGYLGPKLKEGDRQAPEGFYRVTKRLLNPNSKYHLAFNLGYPNTYDRAHKRTGSYLMVHGECVSTGCYAMTNSKIEEIYMLVEHALKAGQKHVHVHAFPFFMTQENMAEYQDSKWYDFWLNLKEGYDYFEVEKRPPKIMVKQKRYEIVESE